MSMDLSNLSANWKKLQNTLPPVKTVTKAQTTHGVKRSASNSLSRAAPRKKPRPSATARMEQALGDAINQGLAANVNIGRYIAIDCEMVGVGPDGRESALARVSMVNFDGEQIYDSYVRPQETVTDWRTNVSGIAPKHMHGARDFETVQSDVVKVLEGRVLVGHSVRKDLEALLLSHPKYNTRDTARHVPYRKLAGGGSPKLKVLASELLGIEIQAGEHSSVEDARATMLLFRKDKDAFEREHAKKWPQRTVPVENADDAVSQPANPKKKHKKKKARK